MKCTVTYDGTNFHGFQKQRNKRTIQGAIEDALRTIHKGEQVSIVGSGRTDARVHAKGQVFHFDTALAISDVKWPHAFRANLPNDILVTNVEEVDRSFHARFDVKKKEYRYRVLLKKDGDVFRRNYAYHFPYLLDVQAIKEACTYFIGTHDFSSFCAANTKVIDKVRTIYECAVVEEEDEMIFCLVGNGFLYNMVRIMVGTLLEVGVGKRKPEAIREIVNGKSRQLAGKTVPGHGLYLWEVSYLY